MTIRQDWENWNKSYTEFKIAKKNMKVFTKNFVKDCSIGQYYENYLNTLSLKGVTDKTQIADKAFECRSTSCFYKVPEPQFKLQKCANVRLDGTVLEDCCKRCEGRADIELFAYLVQQLQRADENKSKATRKLFSNLLFWKQKQNSK